MTAISLAGPPARAQRGNRIPDHPEELRFEELAFEVPEAAGYRHELSNGVPVYIAPDPTLPLVDVAVAVRAGEAADPPGMPGLASLTAALLRRGGAGALSADSLDERIDFLGAEIDTAAGSLRAGASLDCTSWTLDEALSLLFEVLRSPRFEAGRLELAKANLLEGMAARNDDPLAVLDREWRWLLYGREHFSTRALTATDLERLTRDDLVAFHRRTWHPGNMVLAVSGDVEPQRLLARLEGLFAGWEAGEAAPWPPPAPEHRPRPGLYHVEKDIPQGKVILGHLGALRRGWEDPDSYPLLVMNEVLGGRGAVSRILARLRAVEGLAYRASSSFGLGDFWPGEFRVFLESKNETVAEAARLALDEVERMRLQPPREVELELAKAALLDPFPLAFDSAQEIAGYFAEDELLGRPHSFWQTYRQRIEAVTARDVQRVAREHLHPDRVLVLVVGKWSEIAPGGPDRRSTLGDLGAGPVTHLPSRDPLTLEPTP